jgi:hypothetical protein
MTQADTLARPQRLVAAVRDDIHAWALNLPWVVERPSGSCVRVFAVECKPLGRRQVWLLSGLHDGYARGAMLGLSVILPSELSRHLEQAGRGVRIGTVPAGHAVLALNDLDDGVSVDHVRTIASAAYRYALS